MGKLLTLVLIPFVGLGAIALPDEAVDRLRLEVADDGTVRASFENADLRDVLRAFARLGKFQLVLHESVRGRVHAEFDGVPLAEALRAILRSHRLAAEVDGRLWIDGEMKPDPGVVRVRSYR